MFHFILYYFSHEVFRLCIRIIADFYIAEAMINETGCPGSVFTFLSVYNIYIRGTGVTQISGKEFSINLQGFREAETDTVTCLSFNAETYPTCHILAEVQNVFITKLFDRNRFQCFRYFHTRHHLGA